jgi:hypothetical protein
MLKKSILLALIFMLPVASYCLVDPHEGPHQGIEDLIYNNPEALGEKLSDALFIQDHGAFILTSLLNKQAAFIGPQIIYILANTNFFKARKQYVAECIHRSILNTDNIPFIDLYFLSNPEILQNLDPNYFEHLSTYIFTYYKNHLPEFIKNKNIMSNSKTSGKWKSAMFNFIKLHSSFGDDVVFKTEFSEIIINSRNVAFIDDWLAVYNAYKTVFPDDAKALTKANKGLTKFKCSDFASNIIRRL